MLRKALFGILAVVVAAAAGAGFYACSQQVLPATTAGGGCWMTMPPAQCRQMMQQAGMTDAMTGRMQMCRRMMPMTQNAADEQSVAPKAMPMMCPMMQGPASQPASPNVGYRPMGCRRGMR